MKKVYEKPNIMFDSFGIKSNFAASCTYHPENYTENCGISFVGEYIFTTENAGCTAILEDGDLGICYYVPTGDENVFGS